MSDVEPPCDVEPDPFHHREVVERARPGDFVPEAAPRLVDKPVDAVFTEEQRRTFLEALMLAVGKRP